MKKDTGYTGWNGAKKKPTPRLYRDFKAQEEKRKAEKAKRDAVKPPKVQDRERYPHGRPNIQKIPKSA